MITITMFNPRITFDALHDLEGGDNAAHLTLSGHSVDHTPSTVHFTLHNIPAEFIQILRMFGEPKVDDFARPAPSHAVLS